MQILNLSTSPKSFLILLNEEIKITFLYPTIRCMKIGPPLSFFFPAIAFTINSKNKLAALLYRINKFNAGCHLDPLRFHILMADCKKKKGILTVRRDIH